MRSPTPSSDSDHGVAMNRLVTPSARILSAMIILMTGAGVSAVFWKMPSSDKSHALYNEKIVDQDLAAVPLPSGTVAVISQDQMQQMVLPTLDFTLTADEGAKKYSQVYPLPEEVAMLDAYRNNVVPTNEEKAASQAESGNESRQAIHKEGVSSEPIIPKKFEPIRRIVEKKPITFEQVKQDFTPKPAHFNIAEKNEDLFMEFQFVENIRSDFDRIDKAEPELPVDPFPTVFSDKANSVPTLQQLFPIFETLPPLLPIQESK